MSRDRYKIGEFTLDVSRGCLRRGDIEIALRPKSFALLQHLITHAGRLVTKDELLSKIWPNVIVTRGFADALHQRSTCGAPGHRTDGHQNRVEARLHLCRTRDTGGRRSSGTTGARHDRGEGKRLSETVANGAAGRPPPLARRG